ncbi:MAG: hypothetical protein WC979_01895 [Candidatus Pacearchaeota archaeon]|jgi:hypothetical protein|nr:hypothetical protein [Clostridia bacterium]
MKQRIPTLEQFINESVRTPKSWFSMYVVKAYVNKEFDINNPSSVAEWDKKYNGGIAPHPAFDTVDIVKYAIAKGEYPDGKALD